MRPLVDIANAKEWKTMTREEQQLAAHQLEKQMSTIANQLAADVTAGLQGSGVPAIFVCHFQMAWDPGKDPRQDG